MVACHDDGNPRNNDLANLRWDTPKNNERDKVAHGRSNRGVRGSSAKLTETDVREIRRRADAGEPLATIAADYPVSARAVGQIAKRTTWRWLA